MDEEIVWLLAFGLWLLAFGLWLLAFGLWLRLRLRLLALGPRKKKEAERNG